MATPGHRWLALWKESLLDMPFYNRCAVRWQPDDGGPAGTGWLEYWRLSPRLRRLTFWLAKFRAFFWRPFPYFGQ